jgi:hypothetical protein
MSALPLHDPDYQRDLGDGLRLRWSTPADRERVVALYAHVFRDRADAPIDTRLIAWVEDMFSGRHPLITPGDWALVEETAGERRVVAATGLMRQTWVYDGVPFPVGRPEVVASHPDYRRRGLVRRIFELIHARSDRRGDLAQGITGISYYYRQFGYEYALDLGGSRVVPLSTIPPLKAGATEPYTLRPACAEDLARVGALYARARADRLVTAAIDAAYWRYVLEGMSPASGEGWSTHLILDGGGQPVGMLLLRRGLWDGGSAVIAGLAVEAGTALAAVLPSILRAVQQIAPSLPRQPDGPEPRAIRVMLGRGPHPVYEALGEVVAPRFAPPYAWYVRVPDLPALVRLLAPVLERRLADSIVTNHGGVVRLDFYRGGLRLAFEQGRLTAAEPWQAEVWGEEASAGFPPLVFLQLLFGRRSLAELRASFPDVHASEEATPVLTTLFPALPSWVVPLD